MDASSNPRLIEYVHDRYQVGEKFVSAYLDHWQSGSGERLHDPSDIRNMRPPQSVWFDYALSTNQRARKSWKEITRYLPEGASRYLDIGCAYGGSLVAASELGLQVTGIEIDERLIKLGTANCLDHNLRDCIHRANILDEGLPEHLGTFDVITLMSVIEHVLDVPRTLQHCAQLLNPGGILFLEIPNKFCTSFVARDPHFNLFGITLLDRSQAIQYHGLFFQDDYDVGDYYKLGYYLHLLKRYGCKPLFVISPFYSYFRLLLSPLLLVKLALGYFKYLRKYKRHLSTGLAHEIDVNSHDYINSLIKEFFRLGFRPTAVNSFQTKYLLNVWTLVAIKQ